MHVMAKPVRSGLTLLLAVLMLTLASGTANAQAEVFRFEFVEPLPEVDALPECLDDTVGDQVGSEATAGQVVDTGNTVHVRGTNTLTYTVTFADGRYVTGSAVEHFAFNANASVTGDTVAISESRTIFSAEGQAVGKVMIHAVGHITYFDANDNGEPDPGEVRSAVDRFFFTCK